MGKSQNNYNERVSNLLNKEHFCFVPGMVFTISRQHSLNATFVQPKLKMEL